MLPEPRGDADDDLSLPAWEAEADRQRLQLALKAGNVFTWEIEIAAGRLTCSPNVAEILGFSLGTTLTSAMDRVHPEDRADVRAEFQRTVTNGHPLDMEFRLVPPERGDSVWIRSRGSRLSADGAPLRVIGACQQTTDTKRREFDAAFLLEVQHNLSNPGDVDTLVRAVSEQTTRHFGLARLTFTRVDGNGDEATVTSHELREDGSSATVRHDVATFPGASFVRDLRAGRPVTIDDLRAGPAAGPGGPGFDDGAMRSAILIPDASDGQLRFVLAGYRPDPSHWREDEIETLRDLAARVHLRLEQAHAGQVHRANEARYRTLLDAIDEGFCVIEMLFDDDRAPVDYRFLEINPAFERQSGLHAAKGKRIRELVPTHEAHWFEIFGQVATSGEPAHFIEQASALGRWFEVDAARLGGADSRNVALIFTDITERKRADDTLRESEARLRRAIEIETVGVTFFRVDGAITYANDAFVRMSGYSVDDVANGHVRWDTMTPPEWMPRTREAVDEFVTTGRMSPHEKQYIRKDGSRWWTLCAATRLDDHEGIKFTVDITSSKEATAEQARMAAMVDSSRDAFFGTDVDGHILSWNPAATTLYGYTAAEAVGQNVSILMPPDPAHERDGMLDQVRRGEDPSPLETQQRRKDGSWVDVELRPSRILDAAGHFAGMAIVASDATERRRLEQAQDDFLAMASHDLRSPVTVVRGRAQMMKRRRAYDEEGLDVILDQTRRIERLTDDLRELVRLEAGKVEIAMTVIDLGELVADAADRLRFEAEGRRVRVITPDTPVVGRWDRDRIDQALDNLLVNAAKYSDGESEIVATVTGTESEARVSITDRGPGIAAEAVPHLFERFYRVDETGEASGLGLGLYISRMVIEAQGGRIWAESEPGEGSTFTFALPLAP